MSDPRSRLHDDMRALVTGGAGFLGSHLCRRLLEGGSEVVCVDNLVTGRRSNVADLEGKKGFTFTQQDVTKGLAVDGALDRVWHLAAPASPPVYMKIAIETLDVGSIGTRNALELAVAKKARFFLASTSEVYGDPPASEHPQRESYWGNVNPVGPRSMYDESKRFAEAMTTAFRHQRGADVRIVRIFNTYGPFLRPEDGRVVSNFIAQALTARPLTIFGEGTQTRSFCFVSDLLDGIFALMDSNELEPTNLGNPNEFTIAELATLVLELTGSKSTLEHRPLPGDDPRQRKPDITKAKRVLGWEPKVQLREGLARTIEWYRTLSRTELGASG
jgi:nucleoside-diphosphate-sugar epimerase